MHAYLIIGNNEEIKIKKAQQLAKQLGAQIFEFPLQKIEDTKELGKFLSLAPGKKTAILIKNIDRATAEAANAFLKNLEEKENYLFILTAVNKYSVLPTILSRCKVAKTAQKLDEKSAATIEKFLKLSTPQKLLFIEDYKGREEARGFVDSLLIVGETLLKKAENKANLAKVLSRALELKHRLKANTNPILALTNFVVSLDQ